MKAVYEDVISNFLQKNLFSFFKDSSAYNFPVGAKHATVGWFIEKVSEYFLENKRESLLGLSEWEYSVCLAADPCP